MLLDFEWNDDCIDFTMISAIFLRVCEYDK